MAVEIPVVILAAGRGTRMRELAYSKPKHLIEVAGRPFLVYLLDALAAAGCTRQYLVVGYQAKAVYEFASHQQHQLTVINQFERLGEERYGTLMPVLAVAPELSGSPFMVVSGDNLYTSADLARVAAAPKSAVAVMQHEHPERFGVATVRDDGSLERLVEKPAAPPSNLVNAGLYRFSERVWKVLPQVEPSARGEYELTDAVNLLAAQERVELVRLKGYWYDFGRPEDIPAVEALVAGSRG